MQPESGYPFILDWNSSSSAAGNAAKTLKKDFTFQVRDCFNVSANIKLKYKKPTSGGTLCFSLVDPADPETTDQRKVYKAMEYKSISTAKLPDDLKRMVGTSLVVKKNCEFVEGCFLLTSDKVTMYPPPREDSKLIKKPNSSRIRQSRDDSRSVMSEDHSRMSGVDQSSNNVKFDNGNGIRLTDEDIDKEIEDLFN